MTDELKHEIARVNGIRLHYVRGGTGEPVLLVHGWPQTWYEWRQVIPRLIAAGHEVIAVDMRGSGIQTNRQRATTAIRLPGICMR